MPVQIRLADENVKVTGEESQQWYGAHRLIAD